MITKEDLFGKVPKELQSHLYEEAEKKQRWIDQRTEDICKTVDRMYKLDSFHEQNIDMTS